MLKIKFRYKDEYTCGEWRFQECTVRTLSECLDIYGLNKIEYEILEIKEI